MFISIALLVIGFILLVKGAGYLVDGSASLAKNFGVPSLIIGLTVVAFGTSMPELVVNITSALKGSTDLAVGNIVGSNIVNILFVLGLSSLIFPLSVAKSTVWKEIPFAFLASILVVVFSLDTYFDSQIGASANVISRTDGIALIAFFVIFLYYIFGLLKNKNDEDDQLVEEIEIVEMKSPKSFLFIFIGLIGLVVGGAWIVDSAVFIATALGISQSIIGLTIVAIGTSLPELATSVVAAWKKQADMAVGNIVGSNIFNVFWILGISAVITPLPLATGSGIDLAFLLASSFALFAILFIGKRMVIERWQGALFVASYALYIALFFVR